MLEKTNYIFATGSVTAVQFEKGTRRFMIKSRQHGITAYSVNSRSLRWLREIGGYTIVDYPEYLTRVHTSKDALEYYRYLKEFRTPITKEIAISIILDLITTGAKRA